MTLGQRFRELRINGAYMKQRELASALGLSPTEWSHIEFNRAKPTVDIVRAAARLLGGSEAELLRLLDEWVEAPPLDLSKSICSGRRLRT